MARKILLTVNLLLFGVAVAQAGPIRPLFTKDIQQPDYHSMEVGIDLKLVEITDINETFGNNDTNLWTYAPYARYRMTEQLTLVGAIPFAQADGDTGGSDSGLGDISVGFELKTFEDIFDYPWVMPHVDLTIDTASDGLGQGETSIDLGLALGTRTHEVLNWVADLGYKLYEDRDNVASLGISLIWDISDRFSALGEFTLVSEDEDESNGSPSYYAAGLSYAATDNLTFVLNGGGSKNTREDVFTRLKMAYDLW